MSFSALVPARLASTRLPDKPLAELGGKPLVVQVLERARAAGASQVIAATDSTEIAAAVERAGFAVAMTGTCASGTERVAQAARNLGLSGVIVNLQGDEPEIDPQLIAAVARRAADGDCACATAAAPINTSQAADPNIVKVVTDSDGKALLFSRAQLPRQATTDAAAPAYLGHMGIYAFAPGWLEQVSGLAPCALERVERLEQLRWLWHGWDLMVVRADSFSNGIDTPDDLRAARARWRG